MRPTQLRLHFKIQGMDCVEEVAVLKRVVGPVVGGEDRLAFDVLNSKMTVSAGPGEVVPEAVFRAVADAGMRAEGWHEGVKAAEQCQPDVVLCDIGLPGLDGYGVARQLRHDPTTARARLIAVTAYGQDEDRRRSHEAGFEQHLVKPVDADALLRALNLATS